MKKPQLPQYHPQVVPATADDGMEDAAFCALQPLSTHAAIIFQVITESGV
jgi:hypothetical protein